MHESLLRRACYCAHCGTPIIGKPVGCIYRDGHKDGPEVPLCMRCAGPSVTRAQIWSRISRHAKHAPDRSLN